MKITISTTGIITDKTKRNRVYERTPMMHVESFTRRKYEDRTQSMFAVWKGVVPAHDRTPGSMSRLPLHQVGYPALGI